MPHRPTQQHHLLNLASPEPYPSSTLGGVSTPSKHPQPTATILQNPDLIQPCNEPSSSFMLKHFSRLNIVSHKPRPLQKPSQTNKNHHLPHPHPPPPLVDTHLQGKAMASSAIAIAPPKVIAKRPTKEKPLKCKKEVERRKLDDDEGVKKKKKKKGSSHLGLHHHHNKKVLFEDDVEKKSRVNIPPVVEEEGHDDEDDVVVKRHSVSLAHHPSNGGCGGNNNRRRSFCGSHVVVDLCDVFAVNGVKVVSADMPPFMQIHAVDCARKALDSMEKFTSKTLALILKKEFDGVYGPAWHCIVGTNFGSFVTHSVGGFLYFSMDQKYYILLFKTAVQKAG